MASATNTTAGTIVLGGDLYGNDANLPTLVASGVTPGVYGPVARVYVDSKGRIVSAGAMTSEELIPYVGNASTSARGITIPGQNISISSTVLSVATASSTTKGIFTVQSPLISTAGVVSVDYTALPEASTSVKGIMQVGSGLSVASGVLSRTVPDATTSSKGIMQVGTGLAVSSGTISLSYGDATTSSKGIVQVGNFIQVSSGVISIPVADQVTKGIVQVGTGFSVSSGTISLTWGIATTSTPGLFSFSATDFQDGMGSISLPLASTSRKGLMLVSTGIDVSSGVISRSALPDATTSSKGVVQIGTGGYLSISSGVLSYAVPDATTSSKGLVQISTNTGLEIVSGTVNVRLATTSLKGIVKPGTYMAISGAHQLDAAPPDASTSTKGVVQADSTYFTVTSGTLALKSATNTVYGVVNSADSTNISISSGDVNVGTNIPQLNAANTYTAAQVTQLQTDSFASTYAPDFSLSNTYEVVLTGNITLNNPTNAVAGGVYTVILTQDGTGSRTLTLGGSGYKTNQTIVLSAGAGKRDVLTLVYKSSTEVFVLFAPGF